MPTTQDAFDFLSHRGRDVLGECHSLLYVGHRHDTHPWWHETFARHLGVSRIAVIDIVPTNLSSAQSITNELYLGDIRQSDAPKGFDLVFWDEGPEHMSKADSLATCEHLNKMNGRVLVSCPWGYQPQGSGPEDVEFHHWGPTPEDFHAIGWTVRTFGTMFNGRGAGHGNLIAWS